jgi:hypothetical protein
LPPANKFSAFTVKYNAGRVFTLETKIGISVPYHPSSGGDHPQVFEFIAVWDTGATRTAITQKVIDALGIKSKNEVINYTANGQRMADEYLVNIYLPNNVAFSGLPVIDGDIYGTDALIGMDIIGQGDFAVTNKFKRTWMTFQAPSSHAIDFVDEIEINKGKPGFRRKKKK